MNKKLNNVLKNPINIFILVLIIGILYLNYHNIKSPEQKEKFGIVLEVQKQDPETSAITNELVSAERTTGILGVSRLDGVISKRVKIGKATDSEASWFCMMRVDNTRNKANFSAIIKTYPTSINSYQEFVISFSDGNDIKSISNKVYRIDKSSAGSLNGVSKVNYDLVVLNKKIFDGRNKIEVWIHRTEITDGTLGGQALIIFKQNRLDAPPNDPTIYSYSSSYNKPESWPDVVTDTGSINGKVSEVKVDRVMQKRIEKLNVELQEQEVLSNKTNIEAQKYRNTLTKLETDVKVQKTKAQQLKDRNDLLREENQSLQKEIEIAENRIAQNSDSRGFNTNLKEMTNLNIELYKLKAVKELTDARTEKVTALEDVTDKTLDFLDKLNADSEGMKDYNAFGSAPYSEGFQTETGSSSCGISLSPKINALKQLKSQLITARDELIQQPGGAQHEYIGRTNRLIDRIAQIESITPTYLDGIANYDLSDASKIKELNGFVSKSNDLKIGSIKEARQARALLKKADRIKTFEIQDTKNGLNQVILQTQEGLNPKLLECNLNTIDLEPERRRLRSIESDTELSLFMDVAENSPEYLALRRAIESHGDNATAKVLANGKLVFSLKFLRHMLGDAARTQNKMQAKAAWTQDDSVEVGKQIAKLKASLQDEIVNEVVSGKEAFTNYDYLDNKNHPNYKNHQNNYELKKLQKKKDHFKKRFNL